MTVWLVRFFELPPGAPFTKAALWMIGFAAVGCAAAVANLLIKVYSEWRALRYLAQAEESDRNTREVLAVLRERIVQTAEHREDAKRALSDVVKETSVVKDVVERQGEEVIRTVQQAVGGDPPPSGGKP